MERGAHMRIRTGVVIEVGVLAHRVLCSNRRGRIVAVFDRSLYAVFGDDWICIGSKTIGSGPLHVLSEGIAPSWFSLGQDIAVTDSTLLVGDARLIGLGAAPVWSPKPPPDWTRKTLHAGILAVDDAWSVAPMEEGLAASGCPQLPSGPTRILAAAMPGIAALRRSIEAGLRDQKPALSDESEIIELIGLGPGLTPSGDDLLGGALLALARLGLSDRRDLLWNTLRTHIDRTNDISAAHLRSAASGYAASALHEAIDATVIGRTDHIALALAAVSRIGHSSGRDAFAGALIVLRAVDVCAFRGSGAMQQSAVAA
jgi:hypothetical protein